MIDFNLTGRASVRARRFETGRALGSARVISSLTRQFLLVFYLWLLGRSLDEATTVRTLTVGCERHSLMA